MLADYFNQKSVYKQCTGTDERGQPLYGAPVPVACRRIAKTQAILTVQGQVIQLQHVYYLTHPVSEGDMLDNKIIRGISEWRDLDGEVVGYKAVL